MGSWYAQFIFCQNCQDMKNIRSSSSLNRVWNIRDSHYEDEPGVRPFYLYNGNPFSSKTASLYCDEFVFLYGASRVLVLECMLRDGIQPVNSPRKDRAGPTRPHTTPLRSYTCFACVRISKIRHNLKKPSYQHRIHIKRIRRYHCRLIFIMGIAIPRKTVIILRRGPDLRGDVTIQLFNSFRLVFERVMLD